LFYYSNTAIFYVNREKVRKVLAMADVMEKLRQAITSYDAEGAASCAEQALSKGLAPVDILEVMTEAIREVGDSFSKGELWLPDLVGAASAMQAAMPIVEEELSKSGVKRESLGRIIIGTVFGDIHNIGKDMVAALLTAGGFEVHDLGVNVPADKFVKAVDKYEADVVAMSALLTTTASEQRKVIQMLKDKGIRDRIRVMVGGGAITANFAREIGADGYDPTAPGAVELARQLIRS
jgi:corrinoid protein of di/trimethylamine methyltransferase